MENIAVFTCLWTSPIVIISGLYRAAAKGWNSTYMIDTIKEYSPEQKKNMPFTK